MSRKLVFKLNAQGDVVVDVSGISGDSCEALTKPFEDAIGSLLKRELKLSYYEEQELQSEQEAGL